MDESQVRKSTHEPVQQNRYDLTELIQQITPDNLHEEVDFGLLEGAEEW